MTSGSSLANRFVEGLLDSETEALVATDKDGIIQLWNPASRRVFGFSPEEAIGRSLDLVIPERLRARHWAGHRVMETGQTKYSAGALLCVPALTKSGRQISIEFTITMLSDEGGHLIGMAAVIRDVTARFEDVKQLRRHVVELSENRKLSDV